MMIKWMVCSVPVTEQRLFSYDQRAWQQVKEVDGFLGRMGGWNIKNPTEAHLLTFWENTEAYHTFMQEKYDEMIKAKQQTENKYCMKDQVYTKKSNIKGETSQAVFASIKQSGYLLKIGDCYVKKNRKDHFLMVQQSVWNLAMANSPGMTAGLFAEDEQKDNHFFILTRWKEMHQYQAYEQHLLPKLLHWVYEEQVEEQFNGVLIRLMRDWMIER